MKSFKIVLIALALTVAIAGVAQVPEKPDSMMPVIDMAGIIKNDSLVNALNTRLDSLSRRTSNQIVVVTVNDLGNLEANQFATQLGKKWGIGDKKHNNGLLILVKPRNDKGAGEVYIAPGGGLQGALPDVKCRWIIDSIMVPHLKQGDYAAGIEAAIDHIEPIVLEEYEQEQVAATQNNKDSKGSGNGWWILGGIAAGIGGLALLRKRNKKNMPQPPADGNQAAAGAASAATALAATAPQEEPAEEETQDEEEEDNDNDDTKPSEPETYKYKYGGGDFDGGGAGAKF